MERAPLIQGMSAQPRVTADRLVFGPADLVLPRAAGKVLNLRTGLDRRSKADEETCRPAEYASSRPPGIAVSGLRRWWRLSVDGERQSRRMLKSAASSSHAGRLVTGSRRWSDLERHGRSSRARCGDRHWAERGRSALG